MAVSPFFFLLGSAIISLFTIKTNKVNGLETLAVHKNPLMFLRRTEGAREGGVETLQALSSLGSLSLGTPTSMGTCCLPFLFPPFFIVPHTQRALWIGGHKNIWPCSGDPRSWTCRRQTKSSHPVIAPNSAAASAYSWDHLGFVLEAKAAMPIF